MPRFWALWILSVVLRALGVVWFLFTIFFVIALALTPRQLSPDSPNFNVITSAVAGMTTAAVILSFFLSLLYGLMIYAAGQFIVLMLSIEQSVRGRDRRVDILEAKLDPVNGPWVEPAPRRQRNEADEYAPRPRR